MKQKAALAVAISVAAVLLFALTLHTHTAESDFLYARPYALVSYLSFTGMEGISSSDAFITCCTRLAHSWDRSIPQHTRSQYDKVLLITDPWGLLLDSSSQERLRASGWRLLFVEPLHGRPSNTYYLAQNRYTHTAQFSKLHLWRLVGYRHILYLDSDMLVIGDMTPHLNAAALRMPSIAMVEDGGLSKFNAGLMLLRPSIERYEAMKAQLQSLDYDAELQEQSFLNAYFNDSILTLPRRLSMPVNNFTDQALVLHFIGTLKPWNICGPRTNIDAQFLRPCLLWQRFT